MALSCGPAPPNNRATAASDLSYAATRCCMLSTRVSLCVESAPPCVSEAEGPSTCRAPGAARTPNRALEQPFCQGPSLPAGPHVAKAGGSTRCSGRWSSPPSSGGRGPVHVWCVRSRRTASQLGRSPAAARATCSVPSFVSRQPVSSRPPQPAARHKEPPPTQRPVEPGPNLHWHPADAHLQEFAHAHRQVPINLQWHTSEEDIWEEQWEGQDWSGKDWKEWWRQEWRGAFWRLGSQERQKSRFLALRGVSAVPNHVCWKDVNLTTHKVARGRLATRVPGRREQSAEACVQETCKADEAQNCQEKGQRNSWQARAECRRMLAGNMSSCQFTKLPGERATQCLAGESAVQQHACRKHVKLTMHKVARTRGNTTPGSPGRRERSAEACVQETCQADNAQSCQDKGQHNSWQPWQARAECRSMRAGNMSS